MGAPVVGVMTTFDSNASIVPVIQGNDINQTPLRRGMPAQAVWSVKSQEERLRRESYRKRLKREANHCIKVDAIWLTRHQRGGVKKVSAPLRVGVGCQA